MAITSNGTGGGDWSAGTSWAGGVAPGNNDAVIIAANDTITIDSDFSAAWADGVAGITITSHATTPGMLTFKTSGAGTYSIKIKTGTTIAGTNAAARGRLLANSNGTWGGTTALPFDRKAIIDLAGTAYINAQYLDIALYCTQPSVTSVRVYKTLYTVSSINTGTNVITMSAPHGMSANTAVCVKSSGDMPGGLVAGRCYYVGSPSGADLKLLGYSSGPEIDITSEGTGTIQLYDGHTDTGTGTVNVLEDVRAVTGWDTTDGHDYVVLVDALSTGVDQQLMQLTTISETSLVLGTNVDSAQYPDARVVLVSRNVSIRGTGTTTTISYPNTTTQGGVFQCEIRNVTTALGNIAYSASVETGIASGLGVTMSGVMCGYQNTIYTGALLQMSGIITGQGSSGIRDITGGSMSGTIYGPSALYSCSGMTMSGKIAGSDYALFSCTGILVTGTIEGCSVAIGRNSLYPCPGCTLTGTIAGCASGFFWAPGSTISGSILGCGTAIQYTSGQMNGVVLSGNKTDIDNNSSFMLSGYSVSLSGSVQVANYKRVSDSVDIRGGSVMVQDLGGSHGYIGAWCLGGYTKSAAYAEGTHTAPPVASAIIHETTFEDNDRNCWVEFAVPGTTGNPVTVTFYGRLTGTTAWTTRPSIGIYDPTKGWLEAGEELNASAAMASNTDWQTLTATYTPTWDRELRIRMQGKGGTAGGTGTEKLYWFIDVDLGGGGGGSAVSISPVRGWS